MSRRYALKRDQSENPIVTALEAAGATVVRGQDVDLYVGWKSPQGISHACLMECKTLGPNSKRRQPIQQKLAELFGMLYVIVYTPEDALRVMGSVQRQDER